MRRMHPCILSCLVWSCLVLSCTAAFPACSQVSLSHLVFTHTEVSTESAGALMLFEAEVSCLRSPCCQKKAKSAII